MCCANWLDLVIVQRGGHRNETNKRIYFLVILDPNYEFKGLRHEGQAAFGNYCPKAQKPFETDPRACSSC